MSVPHADSPLTESERQLVAGHLEELLEHPAFAGSRRRQAFLRYVVEETLAGRGAAIKETTIAVDVFGRSSDFDAQSASIVRVTGGEVRKRLAQAYASGLKSGVRIELPVGSYQPEFEFLPPAGEAAPFPARSRRWWWLAAAAGALALLVVPLARWDGLAGGPPPLDLLWAPFLDKNQPVLISLQAPAVLTVSPRSKLLPLRPDAMIPASEIEMMAGVYVGTGSALGAALFAEQLALRGQRFVVKFGADVSFADLKNSPAILIGASRWTQELTRPLRFRMTSDKEYSRVLDSGQPDRAWSVRRTGNTLLLTEGYSLVTRLMPPETGFPLLLIAGMDARNTQAAVEFLSRPKAFEKFALQAPAGWQHRSFQVVLHNTIHGNSPGPATVAAWHVW
jgi:hypothetical protein